MTDFEKAVTILRELVSEDAGFDGGVPAPTSMDAGQRLGLAFPSELKAFYTQFGGGGIGGIDMFGLAYPEDNVVSVTIEARNDGLHEKLLVLESTGDGGLYTLDLRSDDEQPVRVWVPGASDTIDDLEPVAEGFGEFLLMRAEIAK